jgi:heme-degrading monooxygenase HmoA
MTRQRTSDSASILEVVILNARSSALATNQLDEAWAFLKAADGYHGHHFGACVEEPNRYILMIWWRTLEDHVDTFRQSSGYSRWKEILHMLFEPDPYVRHFEMLS